MAAFTPTEAPTHTGGGDPPGHLGNAGIRGTGLHQSRSLTHRMVERARAHLPPWRASRLLPTRLSLSNCSDKEGAPAQRGYPPLISGHLPTGALVLD